MVKLSILQLPCCKKFGIRRIDLILFTVYIFSFAFGVQLLFPIFQNSKPQWKCSSNDTGNTWSQNCSILHGCDTEVVYESQFYSAVQQLQLLCGVRSYYATLMSTFQFIGSLLGAPVMGHLADVIGRKPVFIGVMGLGMVSVACTGLATSWQLLGAIRFIVGFCVGAALCVGQPLVYEILLPQHRIYLRCIFNWGWARMLQTMICFLIPHWKYSSFALALLCLPSILLTLIYVPESYRWLESKGKQEQAESAIIKIQKFNGVEETSENPVPHMGLASGNKIYTARDLFKTKKQAIHSVTLIFMFFAASVATYTSDLNSGTLAGDLFLNQFLFCLLIALSKIPLFFLDTYVANFNRRHLHHIPQVGVITCYLLSVLFTLTKLNPKSIVLANLIGTIFLEYTWDACALCSVEGFPTVVRSIGMGTAMLAARIGSILAPQIIYLKNLWEPAAFATVAGISLCSLTISYLFLPDTKNAILADQLESTTTSNLHGTTCQCESST